MNISTETSYHNQHSRRTIGSRARRIRSQTERKGAVEGNKNTLCRAFCPLSHLGYCWQHTAPPVHATIQTGDVSLSIRPFHRGESFVRFTRWTRWIVILAGWRRDANSTRNEQGGVGGEREKDIQYEPQACCGTTAAPTNSLSNSNGQTKPVATLPGWDY